MNSNKEDSRNQEVANQVITQMKGITNRPLSDMESNGVYFNREEERDIQKTIEEEIEVSICYYSGLPSLESYTEGVKEGQER